MLWHYMAKVNNGDKLFSIKGKLFKLLWYINSNSINNSTFFGYLWI